MGVDLPRVTNQLISGLYATKCGASWSNGCADNRPARVIAWPGTGEDGAQLINLVDIQRAGVRTFSEHGYAATSIRDIAVAAGVTSGALYLHVPSKIALLESIMDLALDELVRIARLAVREGRDAADRLEGLVRAHVGVQATNPRTAQVVDGELRILPDRHRQAMVAKRDAYERFWNRTLADGARSGVFAIDEVSVTRLALLEMCNGVAHWYQPGGPFDLDQIQEMFVRLSFNLVCYTGSAAGANPKLRPRLLACEPPDSAAAN